MNFVEDKQACIIVEKLSIQRERGQFCDVMLRVQDQTFKAHRNVLAACSEYFSSLFRKKKTVKEQIRVSNCKNVDAFKSILNYMYTGIIVIDIGNVSELLRLCNMFVIEKVTKYCELYLRDHLTCSNCLFVRELAVKHKLSLLHDATEFIRQNIVEVLDHKEILEMSSKHLQNFIKEKTWDFNQEELLKLFCKWVEYDLIHRESVFSTLLDTVNWEKVNPEYALEHVENCSLFQSNSRCLYLFINFLEDNDIKISIDEEKYTSLKNKISDNAHSADKNILEDSQSLLTDFYVRSSSDSEAHSQNTELIKESETEEPSHVELVSKTKKPRKSKNPRKVIYKSETPSKPVREENPPKKRGRPPKQTTMLKKKKKVKKVKRSEKSESEADSDETTFDSVFKITDTARRKKRKFERPPVPCMRWKDGIQCDKCSYIGYDSKNYKHHMDTAHVFDVAYKCKVCDFKSKWKREYNFHMRTHYKGPPYKCDECDYTTNFTKYFIPHLSKHTEDWPFACEQCGLRCRSHVVLETHLKTHTGEKPFECEQCQRKFATRNMLVNHITTHSTEKPFLCDTCGYSAKNKRLLVIHMRYHTGDVFHCEFPNCKFTAVFKNILDRHHRCHLGVRAFICSYCGSGFVDQKYLNRHERIHLNETIYKCDHCDYTTYGGTKLRIHVKKHHSSGAPSKFRPHKKRLLRVNDKPQKITNIAAPEVPQPAPPTQPADTINNSHPGVNSNSSSNCASADTVYTPHVPVCFSYEPHNYPPSFNPMANIPHHINQNLPSGVPAISHDIPTQFRSFMSFM